MTAYTAYRRGGLLIPYNDKPHLFGIMNDPTADDECLLLMVSSVKTGRHHDGACVLAAGDHPFINHDSYIVYRLANRVVGRHISNMVAQNYYVVKEDFGEDVFTRIVAGIWTSDEISAAMVNFATGVVV